MSYIGNEPIVSATRTITEITATAGQTVFVANGGYTVGYIDVFVNGAQLQTSDFTATNGSSITLVSPATIGDDIRLVAWGTFQTSSALTAENPSYTGTLTGGTGVVNLGSGQFVKDASGNIGVGTASPDRPVHLKSSGTRNYIKAETTTNSNSNEAGFQITTPASNFLLTSLGATNSVSIYDLTANATRLTIDSAGRVTTPAQPAFRAYFASTGTRIGAAGVEIPFDTAEINIGGHYSTSTGRFTAPVAGRYQINLTAQHDGTVSTSGWIDIRKNGAEVRVRFEEALTGSSYNAGGVSTTIYLNAGDYVSVLASGNIWWSHHTCFSGFFIG